MFESLANLDAHLFYLVNHLPHYAIFDGFAFFIDKIVGYGLIFIVSYLIIYFTKREKFVEFLVLGLISISTTWILSSVIFKHLFERLRPVEVLDDVIVIGSTIDRYSFPSSHTAVMFSFFMISILVLGKKDKYVVPMVGVVALLTAIGRIYVGHHFPFDVLFGALLGVGISAGIYGFVYLVSGQVYKDENEAHV